MRETPLSSSSTTPQAEELAPSTIESPQVRLDQAQQALQTLSRQIFAMPEKATELLMQFFQQFPELQPVDVHNMLTLPGALVTISGEDLQRTSRIPNFLEFNGEPPQDLISTKTCVVLQPRLMKLTETLKPLVVLALTASQLETLAQKQIEFPATEDTLIMVDLWSRRKSDRE